MTSSAVAIPSLDWDKFYALLDRIGVMIPTYASGEIADLNEIGMLLARVQNRRTKLDRVANKIQQRLGMLKRRIDVLATEIKLQRAVASDEPGVRSQRTRRDRDAQIEFMMSNLSGQLALVTGKRHQYEHAQHAIETTVKSLQMAKETLNSIKQIALAQMDDARSNV